MIRTGCEMLSVEAVFELAAPATLRALLDEQGLADEQGSSDRAARGEPHATQHLPHQRPW